MGSHHVFLRIFPSPTRFCHTQRAPIRSSCCTWSSCGNKRKKQRSRGFVLILAYFLPPRLCELRGCCSWRLAAAISPSNIFEFNVFAVSLPMFASHPFLRSFIMGNDAKTKINSSRCLKRQIWSSSHTFWTAASSCFNGETILLKTSFPLTNLGGFWEERYWPPTKTLIHLSTIEKFGASPFSEGHIWTACFHNTDQSPFILYLKKLPRWHKRCWPAQDLPRLPSLDCSVQKIKYNP